MFALPIYWGWYFKTKNNIFYKSIVDQNTAVIKLSLHSAVASSSCHPTVQTKAPFLFSSHHKSFSANTQNSCHCMTNLANNRVKYCSVFSTNYIHIPIQPVSNLNTVRHRVIPNTFKCDSL